MTSFQNKNANGALTSMPLSQLSVLSSSDDFISSSYFETNDCDLVEPPMGQLLDPEAQDEPGDSWKEPPLRQPSDLEVESTVGSYDSCSSTVSLYLGKGWQNMSTAEEAAINKSHPGLEEKELKEPLNVEVSSPDTATTVLCNADESSFGIESLSELDEEESLGSSLVQFSPPFSKKQKTLKEDFLDSDTSDDDRKESAEEQKIRLRHEADDAGCRQLLKSAEDTLRRSKNKRKVSSKWDRTPSCLFGDSDDDSNSPVGLLNFPKCWVKYSSAAWPSAHPPGPDVIANKEESDDDYSDF
jgi:hypothetical protein